MEHFSFFVLIGRTGSGKTRLLRDLEVEKFQVLDLEDIAGHRGSAFGALTRSTHRLSQQQFLEALSLKLSFFDAQIPVITEWKGRKIGSLKIPDSLYTQLLAAPKILIMRNKERRMQELLEAYRDLPIETLYQALFSLRPKLGEDRFGLAVQALKKRDKPLFVEMMLTYYDDSPEYQVSHHHIVKKIDWTGQSTDEITMKLGDYFDFRL